MHICRPSVWSGRMRMSVFSGICWTAQIIQHEVDHCRGIVIWRKTNGRCKLTPVCKYFLNIIINENIIYLENNVMEMETQYRCHCWVFVHPLQNTFPPAMPIRKRTCYCLQIVCWCWQMRSFRNIFRKSIRLRLSTWSRRPQKVAKRGESHWFLLQRTSRWWLWRNKVNGFYCHVIVETYIDLFYDFRKYVEKILHEI